MDITELDLNSYYNRRSLPEMTDQNWQCLFERLRSGIPESTRRNMNQPNGRASNTDTIKYGQYCAYINDVLRRIRLGYEDYCYYIYQVMDLLRFEHDRLRTKYLQDSRCIKVWLSKK